MMETLYKKKVIRDFLSLYTDNYWIQLVSHLLEYGIILFKKKNNISSMSPDDIFQTIEKFKKNQGIYDAKTKERKSSKKAKETSKNKLSRSRSGSINCKKQDVSFSKRAGTNSRVDNNKTKSRRKPSTSKDSSSSVIKPRSQTPNKDKGMFKFTNQNTKTKNLNINNMNKNNSDKAKLNKTNSNSNINHNISVLNTHSNMRLNTAESNKEKSKEKNGHINKLAMSNKKQIGNALKTNNKSKESSSLKDITNSNKENKDNQSMQTHPNKLINFDNKGDLANAELKQKIKPESKIKILIENDKKKYQEMKHSSQVVTDKLNSTSINKDVIQKDSSIISLEDKLNGLTQKLSKINSSIDNYNNCFPYLAQHKETNENNDEDYLGEDQIDLNNNKSEDETEIRYYRKLDSDE